MSIVFSVCVAVYQMVCLTVCPVSVSVCATKRGLVLCYSRMGVYVMIAVWCVELCVAYLFYVNSVSRCVVFLLCID
jgi:hypothetical protein